MQRPVVGTRVRPIPRPERHGLEPRDVVEEAAIQFDHEARRVATDRHLPRMTSDVERAELLVVEQLGDLLGQGQFGGHSHESEADAGRQPVDDVAVVLVDLAEYS